MVTAIATSSAVADSSAADAGYRVYLALCADCHGEDGQGVSGAHEDPLLGNHSVAVLAKLIERTMPEDDPEACTGQAATQVAEYIYHEFYSPAARVKQGLAEPPRVELARLTVPQYRNAVADVVGRFTPGRNDSQIEVQTGLSASYYQSKGMSKADELRTERVDPRIDYDFAENPPVEGIEADQFAIIWEGCLKAKTTGFYEFRLTTENGARLYLNNDQTGSRKRLRDDSSAAGQSALIDAWVSSGKLRESTGRTFLLGGRKYPIRVEFFKYKEQTASVRLEWKPPHGVWSLLDQRHLATERLPRTFVVTTAFPADDRSLGYERGVSVSREWQEAVTHGAIETASEIMNRLPLLANLSDQAENREHVLKDFVLRFASTAFRRPLSETERTLLAETMFEGIDTDSATKRAILFVLTSPHFLYVDLGSAHDLPASEAVASRLSFLMWDSVPDKELLEAAAEDRLQQPEQVENQARRMLDDPRTAAKVRDFFQDWLELDERDLVKDQQLFPQFDGRVISDLRYSLEEFVNGVVWSDRSDYRELLLADYLILNARLRELYAAECSECSPAADAESDAVPEAFQRVTFPAVRRAGVLTHPYLLSALAYHNNTSPIHRGVFLTRNIVGLSLKSPPIAVAFKNEEFAPDLTMREKITQLTSEQACLSCHSVINPLGFALENYDAIGRWRTQEHGKPIDASSRYVTELGQAVDFENARAIATFAASSDSAHRAFVTKLFQHLVRQNPDAYHEHNVERLRIAFAENGFNVKDLIVRIATLAALHASESISLTSHEKP